MSILDAFEDDGCTLFPSRTWRTCCDVHDEAFATGTTVQEFFSANWDLLICVAQYDPIAAVLMFIGVMTGGAVFFFFGRKRAKGSGHVDGAQLERKPEKEQHERQ